MQCKERAYYNIALIVLLMIFRSPPMVIRHHGIDTDSAIVSKAGHCLCCHGISMAPVGDLSACEKLSAGRATMPDINRGWVDNGLEMKLSLLTCARRTGDESVSVISKDFLSGSSIQGHVKADSFKMLSRVNRS